MRGLLAAFAFLSATTTVGAGPEQPSHALAHRPVTTAVTAAQVAFDEGLTLLYAFNPGEARRAFEHAAALDPSLAMAYWGEALSFGVNINTDFDPADQQRGRAAIERAQTLAARAAPVERGLIEAAAKRYATERKADASRSAEAFRDAMNVLASRFPDDDDVLTLAAESAMDVRPWALWSDGKPALGTAALVAQLTTVIARNPQHLGANHYLMHALEASPHPEEALAAATRIAALHFPPAAEHLTHMPAHVFMRLGLYDEAAAANARALADFRAYLNSDHAPGHEDYFSHDCGFEVQARMMAGELATARSAARGCGRLAQHYEAYVAIRFRQWSELEHVDRDSHFAHGMAAAMAGRFADATRDKRVLEKDRNDTAPIAASILQAKIAAQQGDRAGEIRALQTALALQDRLSYSEPPQWFFPVRESLGGAFYRAGQVADAERTFRADLLRNPKNPRSLFGLMRVLEREGRTDEAHAAAAEFASAWERADVSLDMTDL